MTLTEETISVRLIGALFLHVQCAFAPDSLLCNVTHVKQDRNAGNNHVACSSMHAVVPMREHCNTQKETSEVPP